MGKTTMLVLMYFISIILLLVTTDLYSDQSFVSDAEQQIDKAKVQDIVRHKVRNGDSLTSLSYIYRTTVNDIKDLNGLSRNKIYLGEILKVPYNTKGLNGEDSYIRYKVYSGDSLSVLASKFKTDVNSIKQINNLEGDQVNIGQRIFIPYGINLGTGEIISKSHQNIDESIEYKRILKEKYDNITKNNVPKKVSDQSTASAQIQITPVYDNSGTDSVNSSNYTNLESNLRKNLLDEDSLSESNKTSISTQDNVLDDNAGSDLPAKPVIENDNLISVGNKDSGTTKQNIEDTIPYIVKRGDNLSSIAEEYHATVGEIKELNELNKNTLHVGQQIYIPKHDFIRYRVARGDNLSTIAAEYGTSLKELKRINNLSSGNIYIGQRIKIPANIDEESTVSAKTDTDMQNGEEPIISLSDSIEEFKGHEISKADKSGIEKSAEKVVSNEDDPANANLQQKVYSADKQIVSETDDEVKTAGDEVQRIDELMEIDENIEGDSDDSSISLNPGSADDINNKGNLTNQKDLVVSKNEQKLKIESQDSQPLSEDTDILDKREGGDLKNINLGNQYKDIRKSRETYKVKPGDNLSTLAVRYGTSINDLKSLNNLDGNQINIGQKLLIPNSEIPGDSKGEGMAVRVGNKGNENDLEDIRAGASEVSSEAKIDDDINNISSKPELVVSTDTKTEDIKPVTVNAVRNDLKSTPELPDGIVQNTESLASSEKSDLRSSPEEVVAAPILAGIQSEDNEDLSGNNVDTDNQDIDHENISTRITQETVSSEVADTAMNNESEEFDLAAKEMKLNEIKTDIESERIEEQGVPNLGYKDDDESDLRNKVSLAQLLTLEETTVPSENDRYHNLVEEQVIIAGKNENDRYVQANDKNSDRSDVTDNGEQIVNFPGEIDLRDLVQTMSEITKESFIVDDKLQSKKVTIITPKGGFSRSNAIRLFEAILDLNGYTVYRSGAVNVVTEKRDIKSVPLPIQEGRTIGALSERFVTQIIPLKNIKAQDVANSLKPLISREGDIVVYDPLNTLIIVETKTNLNKILIILDNIDKEKEIIFVKIYNSDASDISAMLTEIFGGTSASPISADDSGDTARTRRRATTRRVARRAPTPSEGQLDITGFKIIVDERTNSLIVIAYPEDIPKIKAAIERLDVKVDQPEHGIYVIRLKNADAEQIVNVINSLISGVPLVQSSTDARTTASTRNARAEAQSTAGTITDFEIEDVRLTADAATNSVIIVGSRREYESIKRVVDELDVRRKQVYVEAAILEVALDQLKSLGTNLSLGFVFNDDNLGFGGTNLPGVPSLLGAAANAENAVTAVGSLSGMFLGVIGEEVDPDGSGPIPPIPSFTALFQALTSVTDVNILSTPSIVTTDNEEAEIVVADVIPFPTGSTVGDSGVTVQTIDREPVGIRLAITPQIGDGDFLNLQLQTEVSSIRDAPSDLNTQEFGIATSTRTATSSVVVKNGQTIVIGGLVQDRESTLENKVPALGNIPVLGNLFKFKSRSSSKINLMILLTPRIVDGEKDIRLILEDRQKRNMLLQERNIEQERLLLE